MTTTLATNYTTQTSTQSTIEISITVEKSPYGGKRLVFRANANDAAPSHQERAKVNYAPVGNAVDVTVDGTAYSYTVVEGDTVDTVALKLATLINAGEDGVAAAVLNTDKSLIVLTAVNPGAAGVFATTTGTSNGEITVTPNVETGTGTPDMRVVGYVDIGTRMTTDGEFLQLFYRTQFATGSSTPEYIGTISPDTQFAQSPKKLGEQLAED